MQKVALLALALSLVSQAAPAAGHHDRAFHRGEALLKRLKAHPPKKLGALAAPLLNFSSSPSVPTQGKDLTWVIQFDNPFSNRDLSIDLTVNGAPVTNIQSPYKGMFVADLGVQSTAGAGNLVATLYADDTSTHTDIRTAASALDTAIKRLTTQIHAERNPVNRANLEEQRSEDVALKSELLSELKAYRFNLGTQAQAFTVKPDSSSTTLPTITAISPVTGDVRGGTTVSISGTNFGPTAAVLFGGIASPAVTFVSSTSLQAVTPDFGTVTGAKDVELRFTANGAVTNVVSASAYFAQNATTAPSQNPVAIASGSTRIHLGDAATLDGTESYGGNGVLTYAWTVLSAPAGSQYFAGQSVGNGVTVNVAPTSEGTYVFQLVVSTGGTPVLSSAASIAVIQVDGSPSPSAGTIQVIQGSSGSTQVNANDPIPGDTVTFAISGGTLHGNASISPTGLVTYVPIADFTGTDSVVVTVTGQSGLSGSIAIPVKVFPPNNPPSASAPSISVSAGSAGYSLIAASDPDSGQSFSYQVQGAPSVGTASVTPWGLVTYNAPAGSSGADAVVVRVSDNGFPVMHVDLTIPVTIGPAGNKSAPVGSAPPITVKPGVAGTSQMTAFDRDPGQSVSFAIPSQPANGAATVSSSGLVTFTPNSGFTGTDSVNVVVTDNGVPALSTNVAIPVMVSSLNPPVLPPLLNTRTLFGTAPVQVGMGFAGWRSEKISSSNGAIKSVVWDYGDGTHDFVTDFTIAATSHNYSDLGNYSAFVVVTDSAGLTSTAYIPVTVAIHEIPVVRVNMSPSTGGAAPKTISFDASATTFGGTISEYHWLFCGLTPEVITTTPTLTHTFTTGCTVRVRAFDAASDATGQATITVPVGASVAGAPPASQFSFIGPREGVPGTIFNFDSIRAIDPNVGGSLTNYQWAFNDSNCTQAACTSSALSPSHGYPLIGSATPSLTVTNAFGMTNISFVQVATLARAGTHTPKAILVTSAVKGVAPFTVHFDATQSYGFDGATLQGYSYSFADGSANASVPVIDHTFTTPGVFTPSVTVLDSDGNKTFVTTTITVTSSRAELASPKDAPNSDPDREAQRAMAAGACSHGDGAACFALSQMFEEDGDSYTAGLLRTRSCNLGYAPACNN